MKKIGGNTDLVLQTKNPSKNAIGENTNGWVNYQTIHGYLDFMSETTGRTEYNAKIVESTHVFVCDYVAIDKDETELKAICNGKEFDVMYIDNPMELNYQLEIFLKFVGA